MCRFERPDPRNRWDSPLFTVHPLLGAAHVQQQAEAVAAALEGAGEGTAKAQWGPTARELVPNIATVVTPGAGGWWGSVSVRLHAAGQLCCCRWAAGPAAAGAACLVGSQQRMAFAAARTPCMLPPRPCYTHTRARTHGGEREKLTLHPTLPPAATNLLYEIDKAAQAVVDRVSDAQAAAGAGPVGEVAFEGAEGMRPLLVPRQVGAKRSPFQAGCLASLPRLVESAQGLGLLLMAEWTAWL